MSEIDKDKMKIIKNIYDDILTLEEKGMLWDAFKSKFEQQSKNPENHDLFRSLYNDISKMFKDSEEDFLKSRNKIIFGDENADNI